MDLAFWFTFAGYDQPTSADPRQDADLASYGLVTMLAEPGRAAVTRAWAGSPGWPSPPWPG